MKKTFTLFFIILISTTLNSQSEINFPKLSGPYLGQEPPGTTAKIFAPGIISTELHDDGAPEFSIDGKEVFFRILYKKGGVYFSRIFTMQEINGVWTYAELAWFSRDSLYIGCTRYFEKGKKLLITHKSNSQGSTSLDIAYTQHEGKHWSEPNFLNQLKHIIQ